MEPNDAARIGRAHEDRIEWPALNILGQPYNQGDNPPRHNIKGHDGLFVIGVNTLGRAAVEAALALLLAAVEAQAEADAKAAAADAEASKEAKGGGRGSQKSSESS